MHKITPFLWFDDRIEEAVNFYVSVFKDGEILSTSRVGGEPGAPGTVMSMTFRLHGQRLMALNGGPQFAFTEAVSFFVSCVDQAEVDYYWSRLLEGGGRESRCGWLKDRFGLSWQIVPKRLYELMEDPDPVRATAATEAMLRMRKIVVAELEAAADAAAPARAS
jgi:predicted 3-demethylubiquinone-9 3-methyltransferase (glyoxalase superfamily)